MCLEVVSEVGDIHNEGICAPGKSVVPQRPGASVTTTEPVGDTLCVRHN